MAIIYIGFIILFLSCIVLWHSPHDVITDIILARSKSRKELIYTIVRGNLLVSSNDGASWKHSWKGLGPYWISSIGLSGNFDYKSRLYISTHGGGVYVSDNEGRTWNPHNNGLDLKNVFVVRVLPLAGNKELLVALAGKDNPFPTKMTGHTWESLFKKEEGLESSKYTSIYVKYKSAIKWTKVLHSDEGFTAIDSYNGNIYAADINGNLFISKDHGSSFNEIVSLPQNAAITCLRVSGENADENIIIGTRKGLLRYSKQGKIEYLFKGMHITSIELGRSTRVIYLTTARSAVFISINSGKTWNRFKKGLTTNAQADEPGFLMPHFKCLALRYQNLENPTIFVVGFNGLFKSSEGNFCFSKIQTLTSDMIVDMDISSPIGGVYDTVLSTYGNGFYINKGKNSRWQACNLPINSRRLGAVVFSPDYPTDSTIFCACEGGIVRSMDSGLTWKMIPIHKGEGMEGFWSSIRLRFRMIEAFLQKSFGLQAADWIKSNAKRIIFSKSKISNYLFPTQIVVQKDLQTRSHVFVGTRSQGLFYSADAGETFTCILDGKSRPVYSLCPSPSFFKDGTIFVGLGDGIHRTSDGGKNWAHLALDLDLRAPKLQLSPEFGQDHTLFACDYSGLYKSKDRGNTWKKLNLFNKETDISLDGIALSPDYKNDQQLIVNLVENGPLRSTDGGQSFNKLMNNESMQNLSFSHMTGFPDFTTRISFSPEYAQNHMLFASSIHSLYESNDDGISWQKFPRLIRHTNNSKSIQFRGKWKIGSIPGSVDQRICYSKEANSKVSLVFSSTSVELYGTLGPDHGKAKVYIDQQLIEKIDLYAPELTGSICVFSKSDLPCRAHKIELIIDKEKNILATGRMMAFVAFEVQY